MYKPQKKGLGQTEVHLYLPGPAGISAFRAKRGGDRMTYRPSKRVRRDQAREILSGDHQIKSIYESETRRRGKGRRGGARLVVR